MMDETHMVASVQISESTPRFFSLAQDSSALTEQSDPIWRLTDNDWQDNMLEIYRRSGIADCLLQPLFEPVASSAWGVTDPSSSGEYSPRIVEFMEISGGRNALLREALDDLDEAAEEAAEEGYPVPSDAALANARRLLLAMYRLSPRRFEVYPTPDGEVVIDAPAGRGRSVLLFCDSDGGALCLVNMDGRHRRARYSDTSLLPDGFVREALEELAQRDDLAA